MTALPPESATSGGKRKESSRPRLKTTVRVVSLRAMDVARQADFDRSVGCLLAELVRHQNENLQHEGEHHERTNDTDGTERLGG
jgi:hypothetical protein